MRVWVTLMRIGAVLGCHQRPDRSFFFGKYQFPVCARCTGIFIGYLLGSIFSFIKVYSWKSSIFLCIPMVLDGITQYLRWRESNQILRLFTGICGGFGIIQIFIRILIQMIGVII